MKIILSVLDDCMTSPLSMPSIFSACGSATSSLVVMKGPIGAESVQAFAAHPLAIGKLQVTRADVVQAGVTKHVIERFFFFDLAGAFADDDGQFRFEVNLLTDGVQFHRRVMRIQCIDEFGEQQRRFGRF